MSSDIQKINSLLLAQLAAESYLDGNSAEGLPIWRIASELKIRLQLGSNNYAAIQDPAAASLRPSLPAQTRMTDAQVTEFNTRYEVRDHLSNTITGFSATLLWDRLDNKYVLSFRGTEYPNEDQGGDWRRDGLNGADGEIGAYGFAYAQIADMEAYYQQIVKPILIDPDSGAIRNFAVTGYSLGGHLATVFAEAHQADAGFLQAYTFNAPGHAAISGDMATLVSKAYQALSATGVDALLRTGPGGESIYNADNFYTATNGIRATLQVFAGNPSGVNIITEGTAQTLAGNKIVQVYGQADTDDATWVANAGVHSSNKVRLFIEDQPDVQGLGPLTVLDGLTGVRSNFGTTHSITLIADALSVMVLLQKLMPNMTPESMQAIFSAGSNERGIGFLGNQGRAEGDSLERVVESLLRIIGSTTDADGLQNFLREKNVVTPDGRLPRDPVGSGFGNLTNRNIFHEALKEIGEKAGIAGNYTIDLLAGKPIAIILAAAEANDARGMAYRYALKTGNAFAVVRDTALYDPHNTSVNDKALDLYDPTSRIGTMTKEWIKDRADYLERINYYNDQNARYDLTKTSENPGALGDATAIRYDSEDFIWEDRTANVTIKRGGETGMTAYRMFGGDSSDNLAGGAQSDRMYGGGGVDYLIGRGANDHLEGGTGLDLYEYSSSRVSGLFGTTSTDGHDDILDVDGKGVLRYQYKDGNDVLQSTVLAGVAIKYTDGQWKSPDDRFVLEQTGVDLKVTFGTGVDGSVTIKDFDFTKAAQGGYFGIRLIEAQPLPVTVEPIIVGDYDYLESTTVPGTYQYDPWGNPLMGGDSGEVGVNVLQDTPANDRIEGLAYSDWLVARRGGDDRDYIKYWGSVPISLSSKTKSRRSLHVRCVQASQVDAAPKGYQA